MHESDPVKTNESHRFTGDVNGLPKADVVKFILADESWICVRPSGTEPKCKFYIGVKKESARASEEAVARLKDAVMQIVK